MAFLNFEEEFADIVDVSATKKVCFGSDPKNEDVSTLLGCAGYDRGKTVHLAGFLFKLKTPVEGSTDFRVVFQVRPYTKIGDTAGDNKSMWYAWLRTKSYEYKVYTIEEVLDATGFDIPKFFNTNLYRDTFPKFIQVLKTNVIGKFNSRNEKITSKDSTLIFNICKKYTEDFNKSNEIGKKKLLDMKSRVMPAMISIEHGIKILENTRVSGLTGMPYPFYNSDVDHHTHKITNYDDPDYKIDKALQRMADKGYGKKNGKDPDSEKAAKAMAHLMGKDKTGKSDENPDTAND